MNKNPMNISSRAASNRPQVTSIVIDSNGSRPASGSAIALARYGSLRSQRSSQPRYALRWDCESLGRERSPSDNGSDSDDGQDYGPSKQAYVRAEATAAAIAYSRALRAAALNQPSGRDVSDSEQHTYSEPQLPPLYAGSPSPMATYGPLPSQPGAAQRPASRNNLGITGGGTLTRFQTAQQQNSTTTGPMVPLPNNLHPSHMLEPSKAPPLLRNTATASQLYHTSNGPSSAASSAFSALAAQRFRLNFGKGCSSGRSGAFWKVATIASVFCCIVLASALVYEKGTVTQSYAMLLRYHAFQSQIPAAIVAFKHFLRLRLPLCQATLLCA